MKAYYSITLLVLLLVYTVTSASKSDHEQPLIQNGNISPFMKQNTNLLIKRRSRSDKKHRDCRNRVCSLYLKKCPKACPQSCGYMNSPDPCCPLLGKPTCPDY